MCLQFRCYFEASSDTLPPIRLDSCIVLQAEKPYVAEPLVLCIYVAFVSWLMIMPLSDFLLHYSNIRCVQINILTRLFVNLTRAQICFVRMQQRYLTGIILINFV